LLEGDVASENRDRNWLAEYEIRKTLFEQFVWQESELREFVDGLTETHMSIHDKIKEESDRRAEAEKKVAAVEQELADVKTKFAEAKKKHVAASGEFTATFAKHDLHYKKLEIAHSLLQWHKEQGDKIYKSIPLLPLGHGDELGQNAPASTVGEITLLDGITEKIALKPFAQKQRWTITEVETRKWQITDNGKPMILIRRNDDKIQIEWMDEIKERKYDPSINDVRFSVLVITHTVTVAEHNISRQQYCSLFDADSTFIKRIITD